MTKIIGLTGGIGSGKTTIANYLISKGIPVYIADDEAKKILLLPETIAELTQTFGTEILDGNNLPDRKKIAEIVFSDPKKLQQINAIIHPKVEKHYKKWLELHKNEKFVVKEVAILFETGRHTEYDAIILITAPVELRIERVMKRNNTSRAEIIQRIENQMSDEQKIKLSDFVVVNEKIKETYRQIDEILKKLNF